MSHHFIKKILIFIVLILFSIYTFSQTFDGVRVGGGIGKSIYWGTQMDTKIATNTLGKSELNNGYNFQIYKAIDNKNEFGIRILNSELWSFKSNNQLALNNQFTEFAFMYQRSLNQNIQVNNSPITINLVAGVGILSYSAAFYTINSANTLTYYSSIGGGDKPITNSTLLIKDKVPAISGIIGLNFGFKLAPRLLLYVENSLSLSMDNRFTGNLSLKSKIPNNGFTYHALSLYLSWGNQKGRIFCPKF
ncbi:MAG: hypothetical protein ACOVSR_13685 [Bacteroidia bacterium]